ncbi:ribosomal protein S01 [Sulfurihydrogenibium azorense Az-Fu1]|uniref:Ribosomal protein S01 n=1 Tax=Sulfurihydrogenibium azorense (strain DSM 15241 / OCM 825 / Az-Fu1) TaxID=204536 RepID=C1DT56_SULAA|nr:S1 RNA-binding domain-containing protein [Sulfurihydrogenibium azorense]ACN99726.1 ribosomal protein S01 [Sulfurihydrogenibium azorense Az-Fu1]
MNEFEKLMEESKESGFYSKNQKIKGKVVKVTEDKVFVDIGQKIEAVLNRNEDQDVEEGQEIEAVFTGKRDKDGYFILSRRGIVNKEKLQKLKDAFENKKKVKATILSKQDKGYTVSVEGFRGFMPLSESSLKRDENLPEGFTFEAYIVKFEERGRNPNIVISRKQALIEEKELEKEKILSLLKEGQKVKAKVVKVQPNGAVLSIEDVLYGFLPKSEISWDKSRKVEEVLKVGDEVEVVVKEIKDKKPILSLKLLEGNPWDKFDKNIGDVVEVKIKDINKGGLVVDLGLLEGFIPNSEISHFDYVKAKKNLKVGDTVVAKIFEIDKEKGKVKLSIKQAQENPLEKFLKENPVGSVIQAKVKDVKQKVAFVDLGDIEGIVKLQDVTDNPSIKSISSLLKEDKTYRFKVLGIEKDKVVLGIKQLLDDAFNDFVSKHKVGDVVKGKVKKLIEKGAFVDITDEIEGFIPVSEISKERIKIPSDKLSLHQEVEAKIIKIDTQNKKITLSIKQLILDQEKKALEEEKKRQEEEKKKAEEEAKRKLLEKLSQKEEKKEPQGEGLGTLGELIRKKLMEREGK